MCQRSVKSVRSMVKYSNSVWIAHGTHLHATARSTAALKTVSLDASVPMERCWILKEEDVSHWTSVVWIIKILLCMLTQQVCRVVCSSSSS